MSRLHLWLRALIRPRAVELELNDELRHHIEMETKKNIRAGMSPAEARRKALLDFGGVERFRERTRETRPFYPVERVARDVRFALRRLRRARGAIAAVILCLGLGLGATAAVFSFFYGIVLRPLPFPESDRLAVLFETVPGFTRASPTLTDFEGWRREATAFAGLGAYSTHRVTFTGGAGPSVLDGTRVSIDLFGILGVQPLLGREFGAEDDGPGASPTVILGHGLWREQFGGSRDVLGETVLLDDHPYTVIGIMPPGFAFPREARFWVPLRTAADPRPGVLTAALGRLGPGVDWDIARQDMARVAAIVREADPDANAEREIAVRPLEEDFLWGLKTPASLFLIVALLVLVLAAANVANLLLAQGVERQREIVVRAALGAPRRRILGQLLTESLVLALAGGALGVGLGWVGRTLFLSLLPEAFPYYLDFSLDLRALLILGVVTAGTGLLFGLAPALSATRANLFASLRVGGGRTGEQSEGRLRRGLMAVQVGLALAVLLGAGMMAESLGRMRSVPSGLQPSNLLTMQVALSPSFRDNAEMQWDAFEEIRRRVEGLPGVRRAAVISNLPIDGGASGTSLYPEGTPPPSPGQEPWVINKQAQPGYFDAMGIRLVTGRDFREGEGAAGTAPVVVVNESFAHRYWPGQDPLGKRIKYGGPDSDFPWMDVVGVATDVRHFGLERPVELGIYEPFRQFPYWREFLVVRTESDPMELVDAIRSQIRAVDGGAPVYAVRTMERVLYESHWPPVVMTRVLWIMAALGFVLAVVGVYSVVAFSTALRQKELGIRIAVGADRRKVIAAAGRQAVGPCALGLLAGLGAGFVGMRFAAATMFGVAGLDPLVALGALAVLICATAAAILLPARRASRLDPVRVLGSD